MPSILIVDDQPCVRELLSEELAAEGYQIETAEDVKTVKGHLRSSRPDLVILDLYLDGPDGIGVLADIKRQHRDLPVIVFTAYDSYLDDPRLSQADGYVIKSVVLDKLKQKITDLLRQRPSSQKFEAKTYFHQIRAA